MKNLIISLLLFTALTACTHLASVSTTPVPKERDRQVKAEGYRFVFLLLNFNNNFVDDMVQDLARQCPDGKVQGILTKQENITYFPLFAHAYRVTAQGYCVTSSKVAKN